jgi:hypothetical protein
MMRDLSLHLLDIIQNSLAAHATHISIQICADKARDLLLLEVTDNGKGMSESLCAQAADPFVTTRKTRKVGLGLPLLAAAAGRSAGNMSIESIAGRGTRVKASFRLSHLDRPPLGNIADSIVPVVASYPSLELDILFANRAAVRRLQLSEIREQLGSIPLNNGEVLNWLGNYLQQCQKEIFGGVLDEIYC